MALIKKQLLAKEDMLLSADNTPVSQARAGTTVSVHPVNASVIPYDENRSIAEAIQGVTYTHPLTHPVSIIDGSSNPSKFVKTDALGNTGFDGVAWADIEGKPGTYTPSAHEHSMAEVTAGTLSATRVDITADRQFITAEQATKLLEMEVKSNKGIPNGYAPLDSNGKINSSFLSDLNLVEVFTPEDLASMLALTSAKPGDIAYRQDNSTSYMLVALPSSTEANWKSLNTGFQIISVNGQTGIVSLNTSDIAEAANLYFTNERVDDRVAALLQAGTNITLAYNDTLNTLTINANDTSVNWSEIQSTPTTVSGYGITDVYTKTESNAEFALKAPLASPALTGTPTAPTAAVGTSTTQLATTAFVKAEIANDTYSKADVDAACSTAVHKTGNETKAGVLTLSDGLKLQGQNVSPFSGFKNLIINGNFDIWQRGVSTTSSSVYLADRWICSVGTESYSRSVDTADYSSYSAMITRTTATASSLALTTKLERINIAKLYGKKLTLSFYVKQTAGTVVPINVRIYSPTAMDTFTNVTLEQEITALATPSSIWQKCSVTFDLPANCYLYGLQIGIGNYSVTGTTTFMISKVQLEEGSVATPFENRPYGLELSLCQRYYEVSGVISTNLIYQSSSYLGGVVPWTFKQTKRITPTIGFVENTGTKVAMAHIITNNGATFTPSVQASSVTDYISCVATASAEL